MAAQHAHGHNKTLEGFWNAPWPIEFVIDAENDAPSKGIRCFRSARGHLEMTVTKKEIDLDVIDGKVQKKIVRELELRELRKLTADGEAESDFVMKGKANVQYDRIQWSNGSSWSRDGATSEGKAREKKKASEMAGDREQAAGSGPVIQTEAVHGAGFCGFCGSKPTSDPSDAKAMEEEPLPPPKDMNSGFFDDEQLEDIIDRVNDVVGIWGVAESTEREYIKPPVVMMNKMIKSAMETFTNNPLITMIQYLMDEAMSAADKAKAFGRYLHAQFIQPLCAALMSQLEAEFQAIHWIKDKVGDVVEMMSKMVTDQIVTKSVEQLSDSDAVG